jgi:hypothetical protein
LTEGAVVLLDELAERLGYLVGSREHDRTGFGVELPAQAELEALQTVSDERLQSRQFRDVLVDAFVLQLTQGIDDFIELTRVDVLAAKGPTQVLRFVGVLTRLTAKLPDVFRGQTSLTTFPPSAPRRSASPRATTVVTARRVTATTIASVTAALPATVASLLAVLTLTLTFTLALALALSLLAFALLTLTLLALTLLTLALLIAGLLVPLLIAILIAGGSFARPLLE